MLSILINFFVESVKERRNHCFDNLPGIMVSLDMDLALSWSGFPEMESCLCMGSGSVDKDLLSVSQPAQMADCCFAPAFTFNIYNHLSWIPHWPSSHLLAALAVNSHSHCSLVISHCSLSWMDKGFSPGGLVQSRGTEWTVFFRQLDPLLWRLEKNHGSLEQKTPKSNFFLTRCWLKQCGKMCFMVYVRFILLLM